MRFVNQFVKIEYIFKIKKYAVNIHPAAERNFSVIFVRHFLFVHVKCIVSYVHSSNLDTNIDLTNHKNYVSVLFFV